MRFPSLLIGWAKYRPLLPALSIGLASLLGAAEDRSKAPIYEQIQLSSAQLLQGDAVLAPPLRGERLKVPKAQLPLSVALYLKPSQVFDTVHPKVREAARAALKLMGREGSKAAQEDPELLALAVRTWVEQNLADSSAADTRPFSTDLRLAIPKASQILKQGWADAEGRNRVRISMLRALGIPARPCLFRGRAALQYWAQWSLDEKPSATKPRAGKGKSLPKPRGEWILDGSAFFGEPVEAWSLDSGDLAHAIWKPEQELAVDAPLERAFYALSDTALAQSDLEAIKAEGRLPAALLANRPLPPRPERGETKRSYLMLANRRARIWTEGALEPLSPLQLLLPYTPRMAHWGSEARPLWERLEPLATALWTDRPDRLRGGTKEWKDEYKSPPPAWGVQHYASYSLRRPSSALEARLEDGVISGKLLRKDSLAPRAGERIELEFFGLAKPLSAVTRTDDKGLFRFALDRDSTRATSISVSGGSGSKDPLKWDRLLLFP